MSDVSVKTVTLERDGRVIAVRLRQMAHDAPAVVGRPFRYGSGKRWTVVAVED